MDSVEPVNYKYFGISILFLILTYWYMVDTKHDIYKKEVQNSNGIKAYAKNGEVVIDPNIFEMHMTRIKDNLGIIHKKFDPKKCDVIKQHLDSVKVQTGRYINLNKDNIDSDFCDLESRFKLVNDNMLQEREMLKNKIALKTELEQIDDNDIDKIRYAVLELLIDMDIILFLIRSSICKKGNIDLSTIDQIILEIYRNNCVDEPDNEPDSYNTNQSYKPNPHIIFDDNSIEQIRKVINSQDDTDTDVFSLKESFKPKTPHHDRAELEYTNHSEFNNDYTIKGKILANTTYKKRNLEWYRPYDKPSKSDDFSYNNLYETHYKSGNKTDVRESLFV